MSSLQNEIFICIDCETTGLDPEKDAIIEIAITKFSFSQIIEQYETLVDPRCPISEESQQIHHISDAMVQGKPTIDQVLSKVFTMAKNYPIVGHGIQFDIDILAKAAKDHSIPCLLKNNTPIDTLRLARHYGNCPINSLEELRKHFNVAAEGAHRAMSDVKVNIEVYKHLCHNFTTLKQIYAVLAKPIKLPFMPLGKHKGRPFKEIPVDYLQWASRQNFDQDLLFSLHTEIKRRKQGLNFSQAANPFQGL